MIQKLEPEQARLLLRYFAAEQYRYYFSTWEWIQIPGVPFPAMLYFAAEKRAIPEVLCGLMLVLVLFQLAIHPELEFRGREADFPPGSQTLGTQARVWALAEIWIGAESAKLLIGGLLASYMFTYRSRRRSRNTDEALRTDRVERLREREDA